MRTVFMAGASVMVDALRRGPGRRAVVAAMDADAGMLRVDRDLVPPVPGELADNEQHP